MLKIQKIYGLEILDSRGNPTVCAQVQLSSGAAAAAAVPSGASTGSGEAHELRDGDLLRYSGKGVRQAVENIENVISPALERLSDLRLPVIDRTMIELDGSRNKENLGANAMLAVSLACARALAAEQHLPLFVYLGGERACRLPTPMMNILNGGMHAGNNVDVQEFMIVPKGISSFPEALRVGCEVYHTLGGILCERGLSTGVGDEGGFMPDLQNDEAALELLLEAIERAGFSTAEVGIALDAAAGGWQEKNGYLLPKRRLTYTAEELVVRWEDLCSRYPVCSLEDPLGETDRTGWQELTRRLGKKTMLVGDDLFVTDRTRIAQGAADGLANAVLLKPNQIGTLTETLLAAEEARRAGYSIILSHRSGETEDTAIADLAVALGAEYIKAGAPCRSERCAKYNRLLQIHRQIAF